MKDLLRSIIAKIMYYMKVFISKTINNIKFEEEKNVIIKIMYTSILEKRIKERSTLFLEYNKIKQQNNRLSKEINRIKAENAIYNKKISALNSFQQFLLDHQG